MIHDRAHTLHSLAARGEREATHLSIGPCTIDVGAARDLDYSDEQIALLHEVNCMAVLGIRCPDLGEGGR